MDNDFTFIPGYEGLYDINREGVVRSHYYQGGIRPKPLTLNPNKDTRGYYRMTLRKDGVAVSQGLHRLIAKTFIPNPLNMPFINHKNGIKTDNSIDNLEWCTHEQNAQHAYDTGLKLPMNGEQNGRAILNSQQVMEIFNSTDTHLSLAIKYGISKTVVTKIKGGKLWKELTGKEYKPKEGVTKLTHQEVIDIFNSSGTQMQIAEKFGIRQCLVNYIKTGRSHSKLTGKVFIPRDHK